MEEGATPMPSRHRPHHRSLELGAHILQHQLLFRQAVLKRADPSRSRQLRDNVHFSSPFCSSVASSLRARHPQVIYTSASTKPTHLEPSPHSSSAPPASHHPTHSGKAILVHPWASRDAFFFSDQIEDTWSCCRFELGTVRDVHPSRRLPQSHKTRVHKNTTIDRQMCLRLRQTVHAQVHSCSPEGIQHCTQKFRRWTFDNDMRISKRHLF